MIVVKEFQDKKFETKEDLFKALRENKAELIATKKMQTKQADAVFSVIGISEDKSDNTYKSTQLESIENINEIKVKSVINTTNLLDSHSDVHLKGIWNKSVKEQKTLYLLQEHKMTFSHIISDDVKAKIEETKWSDLGYDFKGTSEALVFESKISKQRNPFMFEQYAKGYVKEHSVGMRYIKIELALNSENKYDAEEKEVWNKYIDEIVNKEVAEQQGYFWAVTEAKIIEGSAVVKGSNYITPTTSVEAVKDTFTNEPSEDTQKTKDLFKDLLTKFD